MQKYQQEITDLTVCRAVFAAWVFIYHIDLHANVSHYLGPFAGLIRHGYMGVDGFFILSGLLLTRVHPEFQYDFTGLRRFWGKRLARIYPVHLATIAILLALLAIGSATGMAPRDPSRFGLVALVENLALVHGWGFADQLAWNYPSWSISAEWLGYLLFPFMLFLVYYWNTVVAVQILVICFPLLGLLGYVSGQGLNITSGLVLLRFLPEFIIGMTSARIVPLVADNLPSPALAVIGVLLTVFGAVFSTPLPMVVGLWLVIVALAMHSDADRKALLGRPGILHALGRLSYSFYMTFAISELLLARVFQGAWNPAANKLAYCAAMTGLTFLLATFLYFAVEQPCRRIADRWLPVPTRTPEQLVALDMKKRRK